MNKKLEHYVRRYGWWQMGIIAVVLIITAAVLVDVSRGCDDAGSRVLPDPAVMMGTADTRNQMVNSVLAQIPALPHVLSLVCVNCRPVVPIPPTAAANSAPSARPARRLATVQKRLFVTPSK